MLMTTATLESLPGFGDLDADTRYAVEAISRLIEVPGDAVLCRQGRPSESLHYLLDGQVTLSQSAGNGDVAIIDVLQPVRGIDLANVVTGQPHQITARALTPSRLVELRAAPLRDLISQQPSLATTMLQGLSFDLTTVTRHVIDLKLRTATQRLGCYLLRLAADAAGNRADFRLPVRKGLLADLIGCRQENLSRAFAALRHCGVETHGGRVTLHDINRLRHYALADEIAPVAESSLSRSAQAFSDAFSLR
ncbi:MAG TPA: cyclic nucleotide-binding domain-containing protein [Acetobacteraceae bacterium]|nr:cyclic nucleotide-binding domain-containing protein [Acetobacteraceae bacterium]